MFNVQIPFLISSVGTLNGVLVFLYLLLFVRKKTALHYLLAAIVLMFCIRTGVSAIYYFNKPFPWDYVQLGLSANFLIGPLVYVFIVVCLNKDNPSFPKLIWWHLWLNLIFIIIFGLLYRFKNHVFIWDHRIRYVIHSQLSIYLLASAWQLFPAIRKLFDRKVHNTPAELKALFVFGVSCIICLGFVISLYTDYILGPVINSVLFYTLVLFMLRKQAWINKLLKKERRYPNKKMEGDESAVLLEQLEVLLKQQKIYRNPQLKLADVAQQMHITPNRLSQLINTQLEHSFNHLLHQYRIQEAKELLQANHQITVEAIGYEVGYSSKSTFFSSFKKLTGQTPAAYRKNLLKEY